MNHKAESQVRETCRYHRNSSMHVLVVRKRDCQVRPRVLHMLLRKAKGLPLFCCCNKFYFPQTRETSQTQPIYCFTLHLLGTIYVYPRKVYTCSCRRAVLDEYIQFLTSCLHWNFTQLFKVYCMDVHTAGAYLS